MKDQICDIKTGLCGVSAEQKNDTIASQPIEQTDKITIQYFTDPICSACWVMEPLLRKFELEYHSFIHLETIMGGLLKNWDGFLDAANGISSPADVAPHWEEMGSYFHMPISGEVWRTDPLSSSYPASFAYLSSKNQGLDAAKAYLRRIREMVFIEGKNISRFSILLQAAKELGLDTSQFEADYHSKQTLSLFEDGLSLAARLGIGGFPTLVFSDGINQPIYLSGIKEYQVYVDTLKQFVHATKEETSFTIPSALELSKYLSTKEVAWLLGIDEKECLAQLNTLYHNNSIVRTPVEKGYYWSKIN